MTHCFPYKKGRTLTSATLSLRARRIRGSPGVRVETRVESYIGRGYHSLELSTRRVLQVCV